MGDVIDEFGYVEKRFSTFQQDAGRKEIGSFLRREYKFYL